MQLRLLHLSPHDFEALVVYHTPCQVLGRAEAFAKTICFGSAASGCGAIARMLRF